MLARAGYAPLETLKDFRTLRAGLHGHPIASAYPGVENTSGSLGQGLSFGLGTILAARLSELDYHTYVLLGDGECQEGQIWEAAMAAAHWKVDRLHAIVDHNKYQQTGPIAREMSLAPFAREVAGVRLARRSSATATTWPRWSPACMRCGRSRASPPS